MKKKVYNKKLGYNLSFMLVYFNIKANFKTVNRYKYPYCTT